jgi:hypothetical protein
VPEWAREKIFRRFFRLDESRGSRGNGLGLSLVAAIAKHHGIALTVTDNGPGLRTVLRFPETAGAGEPIVASRPPGLSLSAKSRFSPRQRLTTLSGAIPRPIPNRRVGEKTPEHTLLILTGKASNASASWERHIPRSASDHPKTLLAGADIQRNHAASRRQYLVYKIIERNDNTVRLPTKGSRNRLASVHRLRTCATSTR